ncbi:DUF995 domain-containing protein [Leisingera sp. F5]|uniref:DUF995 domain-containing protein n=1 Tax=Leisingera sp. F5 TaxID=1813816 RepID=UPI000A8D0BBA|nr:DUF995 domain-containing protein [Leisingera sp. F5]
MRLKLTIILAVTGTFLFTQNAIADPKPQNVKVTGAQDLANLYGGKTQIWKGCKGGIYFGANWEAQAYCAKHPDSVGLGKWRIDGKGRVCHEMNWYRAKDGEVASKEKKEECVSHVTAEDGIVWRSWPDDREWWKATNSPSLEKGFKFKSKVKRLRRKLKL